MLLIEHLKKNGFYESGFKGYWNHYKCLDILKWGNDGVLYYFCCPDEIYGKELGLPRDLDGNEYVSDIKHIDILVNALEGVD